MYRLWDISLYSFSCGHYPELREKCQFKQKVTQFIFQIISKTTSSSKKRKYTVADAVDYVSSVSGIEAKNLKGLSNSTFRLN